MSRASTPGQRQFLPAALELQENPPSPTGHTLLWLLLGLFLLALLWSLFGRVDIVVTAMGRVVPGDRVKTIQPPHAGTVTDLLVSDGQRVARGDALLRLDDTRISAERSQLEIQLREVRAELGWRQGLERWLVSGGKFTGPFAGTQRKDAVLAEQVAAFSAAVLGMEKELSSIASELEAAGAEHRRTTASLDILSQRVLAYATLVDRQQGARIQYLELLQQQINLRRSLPILTARQKKLRTQANGLHAQISAFISETRGANLREIGHLQSKISSLSQELEKVLYIERQHTLTAPVTGTVEELAVHTLGGVVSTGQALMKIVPEGVAVEIDALLENKDVGVVHEGQNAEVKIDTFNFTRYGLIPASVRHISEDATEDGAGGWKYRMRLDLEQQGIRHRGKLLALSPGMTASVEIKIGSRRIIEFLLAPLLRYRHESIRER